ncbi:hypothetical protein HHI36_014643 [Cryptolaemus montrouzieri]|uniref:Uncharacterized protein n=1 Tax=Cryptolaemus montrouzieri TaxID=559131 RepID=A0ABD2N3I5_9CUCU
MLQPLDVGVYRSLKSYWQKSLDDYMTHHPEKPNMTKCHEILNPAFISSLSHNNITNLQTFKKAGICPLNHNLIAKEATVPSALTDAPLAAPEANETWVASQSTDHFQKEKRFQSKMFK